MRGDRLEKANSIARAAWIKMFICLPEKIHDEEYYLRDNKERRLGILRKTKCPCSCWMCGNPRRHLGEITLAEKKEDLSETEQRAEFLEDQKASPDAHPEHM